MGQTAFPYQAIRNLPAKTLAANNTAATGPLDTVSWAAASTGDVLTVQSDGTVAFAQSSAGIGGSTGSTDNSILRADGTGGATLQASGWIIADNYTSSPNATVNHASIQATGSTTNVSVSIVPKGTGAFSLHVPDGTSAGGNARGANAVDLQTARTAATSVASGPNSGILCGSNNRVTGSGSAAICGTNSVVSGTECCGGGQGVTLGASATQSFVFGYLCSATASYSVVFGVNNASTANGVGLIGQELSGSGQFAFVTGLRATGTRYCQRSHGSGVFAAGGDAQQSQFILRNKTTTNSAVTLFLDGSSARLTIPSGKILHATIHITGSKSDGTAVASYMRQVCIKNVGGTTSLVGTVNTLGTDEAASTSIAITADDTNDALQVNVTGILSETWRWVAVVYGNELAYGS